MSIELENITFTYSKGTPFERRALENISLSIEKGEVIAIIGHTDATGSDAINMPLSVNRAKSVSSYLESCGISSTKFKTVDGKGATQPVASNDTNEGRTQNRRVEVYMYASAEMIQAAQQGNLN